MSGTADCGAIIQVIINRRDARYPGATFEQVVSHTSPRFYGGTTDRPWARVMPSTPLHENPAGWPATWPRATNYTERWHSVYQQSLAYMRGDTPLPCAAHHVERWFGRRCDHEQLTALLDTGRWVETTCESHYTNEEGADAVTGRTVNAFLERVSSTPVPSVEVVETQAQGG